MAWHIRALGARDYVQWLPLWQAYLRLYDAEVADTVTAGTWQRLTGGVPEMAALGAFDDAGSLCGFAHMVRHPNTWDTRLSCYLEDLFVAESYRSHGVGRALIDAVYRYAAQQDCCRVYWHTHQSNFAAQRLYDSVAVRLDVIQYRKDWDV